jgi:hypothetical protein
MPGAWTEGYWLSYSLSGNPRLSFEIPTSGAGGTIWPWKYLNESHRFDVIKAQLDTSWLYVEWVDGTKEITRIVALKRF